MEADPGLVGQPGDPLRPQHDRELTKQAGQTPGRHHRYPVHDDLAPWNLGVVDGDDGHHDHARVGQDQGGLVGLPGRRPHGGGKGIVAMPQPPRRVELKAAPILVGIDHEHPTGPDACPFYPGKRYEDWQLQDPAGQPIEVVRAIRDEIDARVQQLLAELVPAASKATRSRS